MHVEIAKNQAVPLFWSNKTAPSKDSINIGLMVPFTSERLKAMELVAAAEFAASEINQAGGINGRPLAIVVADDDFILENQQQKLNELINDYEIIALVGPLASWSVIDLAKSIAVKKLLPLFPPAANANAISSLEDNDLVFRLAATNEQISSKIIKFIEENHIVKVASFYQQNIFGIEIHDALKRRLPEINAQITRSYAIKLPVNYKTYSLKDEIRSIQESGSQAVFLSLPNEQLKHIIEQFSQFWEGELPVFILPEHADWTKDKIGIDKSLCLTAVIPQIQTNTNNLLQGIKELLSISHSTYTSLFIYDSVYLIAATHKHQKKYSTTFSQAVRAITQISKPIVTNDFNLIKKSIEQHSLLSFHGQSGKVFFDKFGNNEKVSLTVREFSHLFDKDCKKPLLY
ncbi:ABC transporter substrate-binding protein [Aliikangiella sp. G2MR2-5]|uniref:ABC transporter substrate-binding protein n=1 Tax=Aliikangiella sp. G2MR2-5 TaxID=2788943 RepID=UPI0018AB43EF|nr:ABC transporter substrate-binding protein [Aliikangiella sp. G2MR2-5]